ncbi:MAG: hypothetical protein DWQ31_03830 [Planctomycetota bacterium]|nr:MAG: hypothetical protein DWQ31_03830 [Planctomycetota bacterium]REJ94101.1 MAG: hypothetical protein DWQ35_08750 [Planctomycetota bacterium]
MACQLAILTALAALAASLTGCSGGGSGELTTTQKYEQCVANTNNLQKAVCLIRLSDEQERLRDRAGARQSRETALEAAQGIQQVDERVSALLDLAEAHVTGKDNSGARKTYAVAAEIIKDGNLSEADRARFLVRLAGIRIRADRRDGPDEALDDLEDAEALIDSITLADDKAEVLAMMITCYQLLEDTEATKRIGGMLEVLPDSIEDLSKKVQALVAVAIAQRTALDDAAGGLETLGQARAIVEGINVEGSSNRLKKAERLYDVAEGYIGAQDRESARALLDASDQLAKQDALGESLLERINELRASGGL